MTKISSITSALGASEWALRMRHAALGLALVGPSVAFAYGFGRARVPFAPDPVFPAPSASARCSEAQSAGTAQPPAHTPRSSSVLTFALGTQRSTRSQILRPALRRFLTRSSTGSSETPTSLLGAQVESQTRILTFTR
ncbi:hypothetical protein C8R43DRAFT_1143729 [Mycena crocata]|nr:hypothetical protein C8R43DRAFT_1143729 [Mycena crocata]